MRFYASGLVTNEYNDVLLIQRDDSRTWAPPGGGMEVDELPPAAAARETEEETGVKVLPVRLVALQFRPDSPQDALTFVFRCLMRGGQPAPSAESPRVGFFRSAEPPRPMLNMHRLMLQRDLNHAGGPARWYETKLPPHVRLVRAVIYGSRNARRRLLRRPPFIPPPLWQVSAYAMIRNQAGEILWLKRQGQQTWMLPGALRLNREAPWNTAIRAAYQETGLEVRLQALSAVHTFPARGEAALFFVADLAGGTLPSSGKGVEYAFHAPGDEPSPAPESHKMHTGNLSQEPDVTLFQRQADTIAGG